MNTTRKLLQNYLNRESKTRDIYHDLMPFKVREILLVSNLYDAFSVEREGRFSEIMLHDYGVMNLTFLPRITGVSSEEEAFEQLARVNFDMIIFMVGLDKKTPVTLSRKIKQRYPQTARFFLLNSDSDISYFMHPDMAECYDKLFTWNGESRIFFAIIKYLEDKKNIEPDYKLAAIRLILLVEDDPKYYSKYITHLYRIIFAQTSKLVNELSSDDLFKVLKMRVRPKLILASNYEEALEYYNKYKEHLYCLITDVRFQKAGVMNDNAGIELVREIRSDNPHIPMIIQSSDRENQAIARELHTDFLDKNNQNLYKKLKFKVNQTLGFGNFIFKNEKENVLAVAQNIADFEQIIKTVSEESILFHAKSNDFSKWLLARSEFQLAKVLVMKKAEEFSGAEEIRNYLIKTISEYRHEKPFGKVVPFEENAEFTTDNIIRMSEGALGGKGRGLAFINSLKSQFNYSKRFPGMKVSMPKTVILGTQSFLDFINQNNLEFENLQHFEYEKIKRRFLNSHLSQDLMFKLHWLIEKSDKPLAIRSSGLLEDSLMQAFAGIFETFLIPNNHPDKAIRIKQLSDAVKLVFASVFTPKALNYIHAINHKIGEEEMAVVIQEVVGTNFGDYYYPHMSGVAQSYNYYPFAHMKPEEGFVVAAVGLGTYVVEGENAFRFSPEYPTTQLLSLIDQVKYTQNYFYAMDMSRPDIEVSAGSMAAIKKLSLREALKHNSLKHCASVYDVNNQILYPGVGRPGPLVVNFASILKNEYIPLASGIRYILDFVKVAFGTPAEIEFAVNLTPDEDGDANFYILQVKPLIQMADDYHVDLESYGKDNMVLFAEKGMGNGSIDNIFDIVYIDNQLFDKSMTREMALEIEEINHGFSETRTNYILIGPGRWGTRDRWIGIPVSWPQISNARFIVETSLEGFPLDASFGSHFFHNLTSLNVAYYSIRHDHQTSFINYDLIGKGKLVQKGQYFRHVRFEKPLDIRMDGKQQIAVVSLNNEKV